MDYVSSFEHHYAYDVLPCKYSGSIAIDSPDTSAPVKPKRFTFAVATIEQRRPGDAWLAQS